MGLLTEALVGDAAGKVLQIFVILDKFGEDGTGLRFEPKNDLKHQYPKKNHRTTKMNQSRSKMHISIEFQRIHGFVQPGDRGRFKVLGNQPNIFKIY